MVFENITNQEANDKCPMQYTNERDLEDQYNPRKHPFHRDYRKLIE